MDNHQNSNLTTLRRSTMLRRLCGRDLNTNSSTNIKKPSGGHWRRFSGSFCEWQHTKSIGEATSCSGGSPKQRNMNRRSLNDLQCSFNGSRSIKPSEVQINTNKEIQSSSHGSSLGNTIRKKITKNIASERIEHKPKPEQSDSSTQTTTELTTVKVISNVQLSQSTLQVIFNQVLNDVEQRHSLMFNTEPSTSRTINAEKNKYNSNVSSKCAVSHVTAGSQYNNHKEGIQILRFSATPHTASMEVNMSSPSRESSPALSTDEDSQNLPDSLEDLSNKRDDTTVVNKPPAAFFVSIFNQDEVDHSISESVSRYLPRKVHRNLIERHNRMRQKFHENKRKLHFGKPKAYTVITRSTNFNSINTGEETHQNATVSITPSTSVVLPNIRTYREITVTNRFKCLKSANSGNKLQISKNKIKTDESSSIKSNNDDNNIIKLPIRKDCIYNRLPNRIYHHKTEFYSDNTHNNKKKRIEILEILECVKDPPLFTDDRNKLITLRDRKSKIPIFIQRNKLPKICSTRSEALTVSSETNFIAMRTTHNMQEMKLDQLIANLLIETLNVNGNNCRTPIKLIEQPTYTASFIQSRNDNKNRENRKQLAISDQLLTQKLPRELEIIPREGRSISMPEGLNRMQSDLIQRCRDDSSTTRLPKKWLTLLMLHKNQISSQQDLTEKDTRQDSVPSYNTKADKHQSNIRYQEMLQEKPSTSLTNLINENQNTSIRSPPKMEIPQKILPTVMLTSSTAASSSPSSCASSSINQKFTSVPNQRKAAVNSKSNLFDTNCNASGITDLNGKWSITISGENSLGNKIPELDLHLRFDTKNNHSIENIKRKASQINSTVDNSTASVQHTLPQIHRTAKSSIQNVIKQDIINKDEFLVKYSHHGKITKISPNSDTSSNTSTEQRLVVDSHTSLSIFFT